MPATATPWRVRHPWPTTILFALAYAVAVEVGRATRLLGSPLALVWPAAAVAFVWLAACWGRRRLLVDLLVLTVVTALVNVETGVAPTLAVVFGVGNSVQALVACLVMHRLQPQAWRLRRTNDLAVLVIAAVAGSVASALIGPVGIWLGGALPLLPTAGAWVLRNASGTFVFAAVALRVADRGLPPVPRMRRRWVELVLAAGAVSAGYVAVFGEPVALPLAFLLLPPSMWIALRFDSTVAAGHVLLAGTFVVVMTLAGRGPFAVAGPATRVLLGQAFVAVVGLVALSLALQRDERQALLGALDGERRQAVEQAALLHAVLETIDVGVLACDAAGHVTLVNGASRELHGLPEEAAVDPAGWATHYELYAEDGRTPLAPEQVPLRQALIHGEVHDVTMTVVARDRVARIVRCDGRLLVGPEGARLGAVVAMKDVTELRASERRFREAFFAGPTPMIRLAADGAVEEVNPALRRFLSLPTTRLLGRALADLADPADRPVLAVALDGGTGGEPAEVRFTRADGVPVWCEVAATTGTGGDGAPYTLVQLLDVQARKTHEADLELAALRDPLTGLSNRHVLARRLGELLEPPSGPGALLLYVDLDGFKAVNDAHGHDAGDAVLVQVAERLRAAIRPDDTAVRIGGDEFVALCRRPERDERAVAAALAQRLEQALATPVVHRGVELLVGASVGTAVGEAGADPAEVLVAADRAMYERKQERRTTGGWVPAQGGPPRG